MNEKRFQELVKSMVAEEMEEHIRKSGDYADPDRTGDILDDFKAGAKELDITPVKYLLVHMSKHLRAIQRYCRTGNIMSEDINNRIKDARNYMALLKALIEDEKLKTTTTTSSSSSGVCKDVMSHSFYCLGCNLRILFIGTPKTISCDCCGSEFNVSYSRDGEPVPKLIPKEKSK